MIPKRRTFIYRVENISVAKLQQGCSDSDGQRDLSKEFVLGIRRYVMAVHKSYNWTLAVTEYGQSLTHPLLEALQHVLLGKVKRVSQTVKAYQQLMLVCIFMSRFFGSVQGLDVDG